METLVVCRVDLLAALGLRVGAGLQNRPVLVSGWVQNRPMSMLALLLAFLLA